MTAVPNLPDTGCRHVTDDRLRHWYAQHPEVIEARCFLDGAPLPRHTQEGTHDASTAGRLTGTDTAQATKPATAATLQKDKAMKLNEMFPSRFWKADDLEEGPVRLTIQGVAMEELDHGDGQKERKPVVLFSDSDKKWVIGKVVAGLIAERFGSDTRTWAGKPIMLAAEDVQFGAKVVKGIRPRFPKVTAKPALPPVTDAVDPDDGDTGWDFEDGSVA